MGLVARQAIGKRYMSLGHMADSGEVKTAKAWAAILAQRP
jgi:hypothetical protein